MNPHAPFLFPDAAPAIDALRAEWPDARPRLGIVLGSGWSEIVDDLAGPEIPYERIPGLGAGRVAGHAGRLLRAESNAGELFVFKGRRHLYEGEGLLPVVLPILLLHAFGARTVLLTNASGGIRDDLAPGTLMAIEDHINHLGDNPLAGVPTSDGSVRFPDQTRVYDPALRKTLMEAGADASGIYLATLGPTFETPAEIRAFRAIGADAVGMSTVPEAILANALALRVAGLSAVCNRAAGTGPEKLTHEDVGRIAAQTLPRMKNVLARFLSALA